MFSRWGVDVLWGALVLPQTIDQRGLSGVRGMHGF